MDEVWRDDCGLTNERAAHGVTHERDIAQAHTLDEVQYVLCSHCGVLTAIARRGGLPKSWQLQPQHARGLGEVRREVTKVPRAAGEAVYEDKGVARSLIGVAELAVGDAQVLSLGICRIHDRLGSCHILWVVEISRNGPFGKADTMFSMTRSMLRI